MLEWCALFALLFILMCMKGVSLLVSSQPSFLQFLPSDFMIFGYVNRLVAS